MRILFFPFHYSVWLTFIGVCFLYTLVYKAVEHYEFTRVKKASAAASIWKQKARTNVLRNEKEMAKSVTGLLYSTVIACIGPTNESFSNPPTNTLRIINGGWLFFVFIMASVYCSNLTTVLVRNSYIVNQSRGKLLLEQCGGARADRRTGRPMNGRLIFTVFCLFVFYDGVVHQK